VKEIKDAILKLPTSKVLRLDKTLNKAIKAIVEAVVILLANAITAYL